MNFEKKNFLKSGLTSSVVSGTKKCVIVIKSTKINFTTFELPLAAIRIAEKVITRPVKDKTTTTAVPVTSYGCIVRGL